MSRYFYAVQFWSGRNTTTGEPNPRTMRMSRAVNVEVFKTAAARDKWVDGGQVTSGMAGNCREPVTKQQLRELRLGLSMKDFNEYLDALQTFMCAKTEDE